MENKQTENTTKTLTTTTARQEISPQQKEKIFQLFFLIKKLRLTFKSSIFIAFVKTPASQKELDKWALIFHAKKLPFGISELQTMIGLFTDSVEDLPFTIEAKEVMYDVDGTKKKCIALTFEVDFSGVKGMEELEQGLRKGLKRQ